ncbi:hypothetical protein MMC30_003182 [Trapelia coarctata]|nr:hypothetical protein [Trapelia coarctata]
MDSPMLTLIGRVNSIRVAGPKLIFFDLLQDGYCVQGLCNFRVLSEAGVTSSGFKRFHQILRRGDIISITGIPHKTVRGELSVVLRELPSLLSPCLRRLPTDLHDRETRIRNRHVDFLLNPQTVDVLRLKAEIVQFLRQYLLQCGHIEVQTPILAEGAGGAVARSFVTSATEFPDRKIRLRIAPELWLKRMVIGGFERVFEIGPSFRNEGLDLTHNPEFTTCEYYRTYTDIEELMRMTEDMLARLAKHANKLISSSLVSLKAPKIDFCHPFKRVDFIPGIEAAINRRLPNLLLPEAESMVAEIFQDLSLPLPATPTLPHLLDRLSTTYLEPQCQQPTFIVHQPECLSPLAKSFDHPVVNQRVSARAELFVNTQEVANMYEEENSPFEQRQKFIEQLSYRTESDEAGIDENYLEALEWGLPPTGGFGCGVERLCMLLSGVSRIGDVLSFGTLRNVVSLRRGHTTL